MRILPITVSTDLIQPILDDRKLRTRRLLAHQPTDEWMQNTRQFSPGGTVFDANGKQKFWISAGDHGEVKPPWKLGDILYVREEHYAWGYWEDVPGVKTPSGKQKRRFVDRGGSVLFPNTFGCNVRVKKNYTGWHKRLARFMPKKYARIFLKVTDVRVERLQDITDSEAVLEGIGGGPVTGWQNYQTGRLDFTQPISSFWSLWQKINGPGTWGGVPWVWVISFKRVERPANF